jgi:hypothetical protein
MEPNKDNKEVVVDPFGSDVSKPDVAPDPKPEPEKKPEDGDETPEQRTERLAKEAGTTEGKLKASEDLHKTKDSNIEAMRVKLEKYEKGEIVPPKQKAEEDKKKAEEAAVLFKEIKTSKDLTKEQKEEMTDTELAQFDEIATLKGGMNQLASMIAGMKTTTEEKPAGDKPEDKTQAVENLQKLVKDTAKELAGDDVNMANLIIESSKQFSFEGLNDEQAKERVLAAAKLLPDYKPAKERTVKPGKPAGSGGTDKDPYNIDKIVDEVHNTKESGAYSL